MTVKELFAAMPSYYDPAAGAGLTKTFQWNVTGEEAGVWALKIVDGAAEVVEGGVEKPDVTMTVSDKDCIAIMDRSLDPMSAFMSGRLKVTGDMMLATRLQNMFRKP